MSIPARPPNTEPTWTIEVAKSNDAGKLASLQIAAFRSNELFKVQFPTDLVVEVFETFLTERIKQEIIGQHANVLILRDPRNYTSGPESIVAFAIWNPPQPEETADAKAKTSGQWPPGTNIDMLQAWGAKVSQAYKEAMSERKCYRKTLPSLSIPYSVHPKNLTKKNVWCRTCMARHRCAIHWARSGLNTLEVGT